MTEKTTQLFMLLELTQEKLNDLTARVQQLEEELAEHKVDTDFIRADVLTLEYKIWDL